MGEFPDIQGLEIRSELGRGGMARVYVAVQTALEREVAVKLVRPRSEADLGQLQRLENEARALAGLQHPHIVELYDFGRTADGSMYYVMPLLPGGDLTAWAKPADEDRVADLLHCLLDALAHAHAAGIVHRDIKPENILFDRNGRALLADFGAALQRSRSRITDEGLAIGSAGYMSPEQARGADIDARSDLYGLGVLAYELLTGALPFDGPDTLAIALAQMEKPVPTLPEHLAHWQAFFDRALAYEPAWRFESAAAMRAALDRLDAVPVPEQDESGTRRLGVGLGLAVTVLLALLLWLTRESPPDVEDIGRLIEAGQLLPPAEPNALDALLAARRAGLEAGSDGRVQARLLQALIDEQGPLVQAERLHELPPLWERWQSALGALEAHGDPRAVDHNRRVEALIAPLLEQALARFDRNEAVLALRLLDASTMAGKPLLELASRVRQLPLEGESFSDPGGPGLILVERPEGGRRGYALMAAPVTPELFSRFDPVAGAECAEPAPSVQGCMEHAWAQRFAEWLAARTGQRYRLPTRSELRAGLAQLPSVPVSAWTSECRYQEVAAEQPGRVRRAFGRVRSLFGSGEGGAAKVERRCAGYWTITLGGDGAGRALERAEAGTSVVLLREISALR